MSHLTALFQKKGVFGISFMLAGFVVLGASVLASSLHSDPQSVQQSRMIVKQIAHNPPVKISLIKTRKGEVETEKNFLDDDDWLKGLTLHVTNNSGQSVTYLGFALIFRRTADQEQGLPASWSFDYGFDPFHLKLDEIATMPQVKTLLPGESTDIVLSDAEYGEIRKFLDGASFPTSVKKLEIQLLKIGFSDGTVWNMGDVYRRDPKARRGWSPVDQSKGWTSQGSAKKRTAFFSQIGLNFSDAEDLSPFQKISWARPQPRSPQEVPCGHARAIDVDCGIQAGLVCRYDSRDLNEFTTEPNDALDYTVSACQATLSNGTKVSCGSNSVSYTDADANPIPNAAMFRTMLRLRATCKFLSV